MCRGSNGNNGNNLDLMVSVRHELSKNDVTGHALLTIQKFIESLDYVDTVIEPTTVLVSELITAYKWLPQLCSMATFLPIFSDIIVDGMVKIEDVPKFDKLMYKVMGE